MKYVLAMDVAKGKSMVLFMSSSGEELINPYEVNHTLNDFNVLKEKIESLVFDESIVTVFMESTSTYHLCVERYFRNNTNYEVHVINPLHSANYKNNLRKTKTDKEDCYNLADLHFSNKIVNYGESGEYFKNLKAIASEYNHKLKILIKSKIRYKMLVNLIFPEYEEIFKRDLIYSDVALELIFKYPHPDILSKAHVNTIAKFMFKLVGKRHLDFYLKKAIVIKNMAKSSFSSVSDDSEIVSNLKSTITTLSIITTEIESLRTKLIFKAEEYNYFNNIVSIPGIGKLTVALIIAEIGDIIRFNNIKQLTAYCGLDPSIKQSGKTVNGESHISKVGNSDARKILFLTVRNIIMYSALNNKEHPIYIYYQKKRSEGKHYYVSIVDCTTKLLRIILAICKQNTLYK